MSKPKRTSKAENKHERKKRPIWAIVFGLFVVVLFATLFVNYNIEKWSETPNQESETISQSAQMQFDLPVMSQPRIIGESSAPIEIKQYTSFTCGGCGAYFKTVFSRLKKEYIDTGKAYLVFHDIPRNTQDISISAITRCIPHNEYPEFIENIYAKQEELVKSGEIVQRIKDSAIQTSASSDLIMQCYNSQELRQAIVTDAKQAFAAYEIEYTPTLVINKERVIMGLSPYEEIRDAIEKDLAIIQAVAAEQLQVQEIEKEAQQEEIKLASNNTSSRGTSVTASDIVDIKGKAAQPPAFIEPQAGEPEPASASAPETSAPNEKKDEKESLNNDLNIDALSKPRTLGNPDAPIKILYHSSFTCGACQTFHLNTLPMIKKEYVDTGKVYIIYDDFPRNRPDIIIGAIARCAPEKSYFKFIDLIYKAQRQWIRRDDYEEFVIQNAQLTGANPDLVKRCAQNKELHDALAARGQKAYENLGVNSTPTFIINDKERVVGAVPYAQIKRTLDAELAKTKQ
ncbi:MAG: thioredoxin domain-containing protein [Alphaproteobacteria bacterium]